MLGEGPAAYVAQLAEAGLPLEAGLRAFSEEAPSWRLRRTLRRMSSELEQGRPPEQVLSESGRGVPGYLRGLVRAGIQCGQLGGVLEEFLRTVRRRRELRTQYWLAFAYPLLLMPVIGLGGVFLMYWIVPKFKDIFNDFGVQLPSLTLAVISIADTVVWLVHHWFWVLVIVAVLASVVCALRFLPGRASRVRWWQHIPLVGTPSRMRGLSEFCSLLGLLVGGRIPLPEALRLTAGAMDDPNLRQGAERLAVRVESGETVEDAVRILPHFTPTLANLFRWANREGTFAEALRTAGDLYAARAQVQSGMAALFFQPWLMLIGGGFLGLLVISLFLPLIKLLNELS